MYEKKFLKLINFIACSQLHASCISCNSSTQCTGCSSGVASGAGCITACGAGTFNENGICQRKY